jgi:hypothetical protein
MPMSTNATADAIGVCFTFMSHPRWWLVDACASCCDLEWNETPGVLCPLMGGPGTLDRSGAVLVWSPSKILTTLPMQCQYATNRDAALVPR